MSACSRRSILVSLFFGIYLFGCGEDTAPVQAADAFLPDDAANADAGFSDADFSDADFSDDLGETDSDPDQNPWPPPRSGCNGHWELCERPFHEVVFPATHNAMSNAAEAWIAPNQNVPLRTQLIDGIRTFLLDTYEENGEVLLCHGFCRLGSRPLLDAMIELRSFLDANPDEVITIIFEDHIPASRTAEVLEEADLLSLIYTHHADQGWPTLGELVASNTRLIISAESAGPPPSWLHNIWQIGWDTPYTFSSLDGFNCEANRGSTSNDLFLVNHWVLDPLPRQTTAALVNSYETLMARIDDCQVRWQRLPTFIAVDFHDIGDIFEVVDVLNGVRPYR